MPDILIFFVVIVCWFSLFKIILNVIYSWVLDYGSF